MNINPILQAEKIYNNIKPQLVKRYRSIDYVVIEPSSGDYYVDNFAWRAGELAKQNHPEAENFIVATVGSFYGRI